MNDDARAVARECSELSARGAIGFGEVVMRLSGADVERYHADLVRAETVYYWPDGSSESVGGVAVDGAAALTFSASDVETAVRAAQAGAIKYKTFCERVLRAGCVGYHVHIGGKRVVYYGRNGDSHVEWFPGAKS